MSSYYVYSGQTSSGLALNYDSMHVSSGGKAVDTTVYDDGYMRVFSGGEAMSTTISGGEMYVSSGGRATSTTMNDGWMYIFLST